jgi:MFS family permease
LVTCAQFSSPLLLGPLAGVATQRFGGRRTLLITQLAAFGFAGLMTALVIAGPINTWWLGFGAIASGLAFTFALPARNVTVRRLVPAGEVEPAFAMDSVSYNLGRAVAPPVSVALVLTLGFGWAFGANAVSFLVFALCLVLAGRGSTGSVADYGKRERSGLKDGFVIARHDWRIAVPLLMVAAVTVADDPVLVLGPALASHLNVAYNWSGYFIAALGAGTVLGSLRPSRHNPSLRRAAMALALLSVCMMCFVLLPWGWGSLAAAFGAGVTCLMANSATKTLLARRAGPEREASVMAVWAIAWAGSKPLASLTDGLMANWVGLKWTGIALALPALVPLAILIGLMIFFFALRRRKAQPNRPPAGRWDQLASSPMYQRAETYLLQMTTVAGQEKVPTGTQAS